MRKPRDFDAELNTLNDKAAMLKSRKVRQLGELVIATGADALAIDELAGALVTSAATREPQKREEWSKKGQAFFQGKTRTKGNRPKGNNEGGPKGPDSDTAR